MKEVESPKCDSVFEMDASGYADIVKQVRSEEFDNELKIRLKELKSTMILNLNSHNKPLQRRRTKKSRLYKIRLLIIRRKSSWRSPMQ